MPKRFTSSIPLGDVSTIGAPLHLPFSGRSAANRILNPAMSERLASWDENDRSACGVPLPELVNLYRRWGEGQAGIILSGNVMVVKESLESKGNAIIPPDATIGDKRFEAFAEVAKVGKEKGSLMVAQISHPGRQTMKDVNPDPINVYRSSPEENRSFFGPQVEFAKPHPATHEEIQSIIDSFVHAAQYLEVAGWDGAELHGAHGYLLAQFLSRPTNLRTDEYGGSLENRARIIVEIARKVRSACSPSFILGIKLNSVEFQDAGLKPDEAALICEILEQEKFDFVELSGGTYEEFAFEHKRDSTRQREGFFLSFAEQIVPSLKKTKSYVTGGFKTTAAIANALKTVDGVGIGRPIVQEPDLAKNFIEGKVEGAVKCAVEGDAFFVTGMVAGAQMRQMGEGREPFDSSDGEKMRVLQEVRVKEWMEELGRGGFVSQPHME